MPVVKTLATAALGLWMSCVSAAPVVTRLGPVQGVRSAEVESFKGIPYAQPPVGKLRWRAPVAPARWQHVFKADHFGSDCMQFPFPGDAAPLGVTPAEDCLYLNVWRPAAGSTIPRPVLVWIYGGGFVNGGSSPAVYDGSAFARQGIVFVSFNYRLGRFGFFGHPALTAEAGAKGLLGNYGYMDQIAALKWVQQNIGAFGGDPDQVTIMGESAGGASVHTLMASSLAKGLFRNAMVMSGGGRGFILGARRLSEDLPGLPSAETVGMNFAASAGIKGRDANALRRLRALPAEQVVAGLNMSNMRSPEPSKETYSGPMVDGRIASLAPDAVYAQGISNAKSVMVGATGADIGFSSGNTLDSIYARFGTRRSQAEAAYDPAHKQDVARLGHDVAMDNFMVEPARHVARLIAKSNRPAFLYRFSYVAESMRAEWPDGAPHATDIPFFFNTVAARYGDKLTPRDAAMAGLASTYVANFTKHGNPNWGAEPGWPAIRPDDTGVFDFSLNAAAGWIDDPWKARLNLMEESVQSP
jgi:para-nitrobenzyl esterase